jgi:hypothetical protein
MSIRSPDPTIDFRDPQVLELAQFRILIYRTYVPLEKHLNQFNESYSTAQRHFHQLRTRYREGLQLVCCDVADDGVVPFAERVDGTVVVESEVGHLARCAI